jgi:hypothetical protein
MEYRNNTTETGLMHYAYSEYNRINIINHLISIYKFNTYLEIGVQAGECISNIIATYKDGVDPGVEGFLPVSVNYPMTSDKFFETISSEMKYDIIFIDGLHHSAQVYNDIKNSFNHLTDGGFIVLHDCNPFNYHAQVIPRKVIIWNGDVWKAFVNFKLSNPQYKCYTVDTDWGVGIIENNNNIIPTFNEYNIEWNEFDANRTQMLNLISIDEFKNTHKIITNNN